MKKTLLAAASVLALTTAAQAEVKIGILLGFTGGTESLSPDWAASAEIAVNEANESGLFLGGETITTVRGDTGCNDAQLATTSAERLITVDDVAAIVGAACSSASIPAATNVAIPNGVVMISPASTSPALTTIEDNGFFFRTAPSDARQGEVLADVAMERGYESIAVTYVNNDYGKGLADAFAAAFEAKGGTVTISAAHEDDRGDYSADVGALAAAGGDALAVFGYLDRGGRGILEGSIDSGAYENFIMADGMVGASLLTVDSLGDMDVVATAPGTDADNADNFNTFAAEQGLESENPYRGESYDAAALLILGMQAAGSADRSDIAEHIMDVANAPGEPIGPGELAKGLELLAAGTDIDYQGATVVELTEVGEAAGSYTEWVIEDGDWNAIGVR